MKQEHTSNFYQAKQINNAVLYQDTDAPKKRRGGWFHRIKLLIAKSRGQQD